MALVLTLWIIIEGCNAPPITITQSQIEAVFTPGMTMRLFFRCWCSSSARSLQTAVVGVRAVAKAELAITNNQHRVLKNKYLRAYNCKREYGKYNNRIPSMVCVLCQSNIVTPLYLYMS